jgi:hypothetical protein
MRRLVVVLVLAVSPAACGGSKHHAREVRLAGADGVTYALPPGWHAAPRSLTPQLRDPKELLTVGTGRLPRGGRCSHMPSAALTALRPTDVLVTVQERHGDVTEFPQRAAHFELPPATRTDAQPCAGSHASFATHWFEFADRGRGFHVLVAVGRSASAERVRDAVAILDSLRVGRAG